MRMRIYIKRLYFLKHIVSVENIIKFCHIHGQVSFIYHEFYMSRFNLI